MWLRLRGAPFGRVLLGVRTLRLSQETVILPRDFCTFAWDPTWLNLLEYAYICLMNMKYLSSRPQQYQDKRGGR